MPNLLTRLQNDPKDTLLYEIITESRLNSLDDYEAFWVWKLYWTLIENNRSSTCIDNTFIKLLDDRGLECWMYGLLSYSQRIRKKQPSDHFIWNFIMSCLTTILDRIITLREYVIIWVLEVIRILNKKANAVNEYFIKGILKRLNSYRKPYKILSSILRLPLQIDTLQEHVTNLLNRQECQNVISTLVNEEEQEYSARDNLGLVMLNQKPYMKIFLMRSYLYYCSLGKPLEIFIKIKPWQYSIALMALFNDHEGLLIRALIATLNVELSDPGSLPMDYFCSVVLYKEYLDRCQWRVDGIVNSILEIPRMISYLMQFYDAVVEGFLYHSEFIMEDLKTFHRELLLRVGEISFLTPLSRKIQKLINN